MAKELFSRVGVSTERVRYPEVKGKGALEGSRESLNQREFRPPKGHETE